jgi:hypothetical protein
MVRPGEMVVQSCVRGGDAMATLVLGGVFGLIGMAAVAYGKRSSQIGVVIGGVLLMIFPYVVPNVAATAVIGVAILVGMYLCPG